MLNKLEHYLVSTTTYMLRMKFSEHKKGRWKKMYETYTQTERNNSAVDSVGITITFFIMVYLAKRVRNSVLHIRWSIFFCSFSCVFLLLLFATTTIMKWNENNTKNRKTKRTKSATLKTSTTARKQPNRKQQICFSTGVSFSKWHKRKTTFATCTVAHIYAYMYAVYLSLDLSLL